MANCTPVNVEAAEFCDNLEDEQAGLKEIIPVWLHQDVESYPAYTDAVDLPSGVTEMVAQLKADGPIVMKATKFPIQLHCILEKNNLKIQRQGKRSWVAELKIQVQNTAHNRGVMHNLCSNKFSIGAPQTEGDMILLGQSDGTSVGFLATVKEDGVMSEFGTEFSDDKYIEVTIEAKPKHPVVYAEAIAYS